ncbi:nucleoside recognition domain-containing protein [Paenibacillus faecalis]|uniref:nucleoside recognition domain-containing protein n=1 Tax=Paenibacillus faecalis TaxID=2079532 RepID=UPI000D111947|nr:nucleoside recognition domain-containing protein [Paenibacillus faecalis]
MNKGHVVNRSSSLWTTIVLGAAAFLLVLAVVSAPESAFQASLQALKLWWNIVFPALLPFLVLIEIIIAYGWAHGVGILLNPFMRKVFKISGSGGTVLITGMIAGFPAGAQISTSLIKQGELGVKEAGKLAALSHFCNPMTILVVVGVGLLHQPAAGYFLLIVHWIAGWLAAWSFSFKQPRLGSAETGHSVATKKYIKQTKSASLLLRAANAASKARVRDGRSFGKLLGDSVTRSVQTLMMTGGFIMIFAVIVKVLSTYLFPYASSYVAGVLEIHIGTQTISESTFHSTSIQLALLSAVLAWSGISGHLQSMSVLPADSIKWTVFVGKRLLHTVYAFSLALIFWKPAALISSAVHPAFSTTPQQTAQHEHVLSLWSNLYSVLKWQMITFFMFICLLVIASRIISRLSR